MSYTKTQWNNDTAPAINETNLNKIEQGIYDNDSAITTINTNIGDLSDLETTTQTDIVSAINENVDNIGDLTTLTTTANTDLVSAVNELDSDKLDATGTAVNSTKWNNMENDISTTNNTDNWIPVINQSKLQHTTKANIFTTGANVSSDTSATLLSNYFSTVDINRIVKTGKVAQFAFRGLVANAIPANTSCMSGLPPAYIGSNNAIQFNVSDDRYPTILTPYWGFTDGSGNLKTSGISAGKWVHINITYVMA